MSGWREEILADGIRLINADCREVLPTLGPVDAVVTDPPYGIDFEYLSHDDNENDWYLLINEILPILRKKSKITIMPNCRMQAMGWWFANHNPEWIIAWYKGSPGHRSSIGFNDWEPHLVWGKPPKQMHDYFQTPLNIEKNGHPCPKPLQYSKWLVSRAAERGGIVLDPFMGSGTTCVACVQLGRKFIGIEIEPKYFDIAVRRVSDELNRPRLPLDEPKQKQIQEAML